MSQSKQFSDGKVLRSDNVTLIMREVRELYMMIKSGNNDIDDVEKISSIGAKVRRALGEYYEHADQLSVQTRSKLRGGAHPQMVEMEFNLAIETLDETEGTDYVADIPLTIAEWQWIKDRMKDRRDYSGDDRAVERVLRIRDAVNEAKPFQKYIGDQIWVKGEPQPLADLKPEIGQAVLKAAGLE